MPRTEFLVGIAVGLPPRLRIPRCITVLWLRDTFGSDIRCVVYPKFYQRNG